MNAEQKKHLSKLRKLIGSDDLDWVQQGLELLDALEEPALWAIFAAGLSVDGEGKVVIPEGGEVHATVAEAHRVHVALWMLNRTGRLQEVTRLDLSWCKSLQNVDVLKSLPNLTNLDLRGCASLQGIAPERRSDVAQLGGRALISGSLTTFLSACIAGMLL